MRWINVVFVMVAAWAVAGSGCANDPVGPSYKGANTVQGKVIFITTDGGTAVPDNVTVTMSGQGISVQAPVADDGTFVFESIADGEYSIVPVRDGYVFQPAQIAVSVDGSDTDAGVVYAGILGPEDYIITGRVLDGENRPARDVRVMLHHPNGVNSDNTRENGSFVLRDYGTGRLEHGNSYALSAVKPARFGDGYHLKPDTSYVTITDNITVCDFYYDNPLYSVTGTIIDRNGVDLSGISIYLRGIDPPAAFFQSQLDGNGNYRFSSLPEGTYRLTIEGTLNSWYHIEETDNEVVIDGGDVHVKDHYSYYDGPTIYWLSGIVTDPDGNGIAEATVDVEGVLYLVSNAVTRSDGTFSARVQINKNNRETLLVSARKPGYYFEPSGFDAGSVSWQSGIKDGGTMNVPAFVGYDQEKFDAAPYFPLSIGNHWTYERTGSEGEPWSVAVNDVLDEHGTAWYSFDGPGPGGYQVFRIVGNDIMVTDRDGSEHLFLQFGKEAGASWMVKQESGLYDHIGSYQGTRTITVPAGTFDCEVFRIIVNYGESTRQTTNIWFASDIGMVRMERILSEGDTIIDTEYNELEAYGIQ